MTIYIKYMENDSLFEIQEFLSFYSCKLNYFFYNTMDAKFLLFLF